MKTKTYVIAEIGINHNGSLENALKMIDIVVVSGCQCVKFQKRNPDKCMSEDQKTVMKETPWGRMTYLEYRHKLEFNKSEYDTIDKYCRAKNIEWTASVWDIDSLDFILSYNVPFIKIPSALLTNDNLLTACCKSGKDIFIATGMSTLEEIDHAVDLLQKHATSFLIMHCNASYPASIDELNLNCIETFKKRYNCRVGYSGHEFELITTIIAVALGAEVVERHITLDRTDWGTDQLASVEPHGLLTLMNGIAKMERALGNGEKVLYDSELHARKKLRGY